MKNSVGSLASWWKQQSSRLKPAIFSRTAGFAFHKTDASAVPIWASAWEISSSWIPNSFAGREQRILIGLTSLTTNGRVFVEPKLNRRRALFVLDKVDEILSWERHAEQEKDTRFVELGRYLCEVRAGQYWRLESLVSFDDFLTKRFPESRRKAYYLMAIHEQLPRRIHHDLQQVGWSKAAELAKVARRDGDRFDCATWLHKAIELPKEGFKREVEKHLTGQETEPWEIIYFKLYKSQLPVIERALETAALMLGTSKSRGYCLEMICADFLAGASLETGNQDALLSALTRLIVGLALSQRKQLFENVQVLP